MDISDDGFLSLMDDTTGDTKDDVKVPESDVGKDIKSKFLAEESFMVTILKACGEEMAVGLKAITK